MTDVSEQSVAEVSSALDYPTSWPRAATPCDLVPKWAGEFVSFGDWVNFGTKRLTGCRDKLMGGQVQSICIDALGRRCTMGAHFQRARDENTFPVRYFWECEPQEHGGAQEIARQIDSLYEEATNNPCTCEHDENSCRYCTAWSSARTQVEVLLSALLAAPRAGEV